MKPDPMKQVLIGSTIGALSWTATEYVAHRWLLHGPVGRLHRAHHRDPMATNLAARLAGHLAIAAISGVGARLMCLARPGLSAGVRAAAACWSAGYSTYEVLHWNAHHRDPQTRYAKRLRDRHMSHHFGAPKANLGVTMGWWDSLAGTHDRDRAASQRG